MPGPPALTSIRSALTAGQSATAALRDYRSLGGSIRTQDWYRLYSQTAALRAQVPTAMARPKDAPITEAEIVERTSQTARGIGNWVAFYQRTRGESDLIVGHYLIKSPEPMTPEEVEAEALRLLTQHPDEYDRIILGVNYTGTERFVPAVA